MVVRIYPRLYSKEDFIKFLVELNVNEKIIKKLEKLPETIIQNGHKYDLYINATWYNFGDKHFNYELNYYSKDLIEFLFNSKVFNDVELSINNLLCNLMNAKLI